jgi:bile acid:Na+ symporter, BASS family
MWVSGKCFRKGKFRFTTNMQTLIIILVSFTIAEMMFAIGLQLTFSKLAASITESPGLVINALLANFILVPAITLLVIRIFHIPLYAAAGLMILGAAPAAPYGPPFTAIARGNLAFSTALMVLLAGTSAFMTPLILHLSFPYIDSAGLFIHVDAGKLIGTLFFIQLFPLCLGLSFGQWLPKTTSLLRKPAGLLSAILNSLMIVCIGCLQLRVFSEIRLTEIIFTLLLVTAGLYAGWMLGFPVKENRKSLSIITAMRNMSLSMAIAASSFPASPVVTTVLIYSFVAGSGVLGFAFLLRKTV